MNVFELSLIASPLAGAILRYADVNGHFPNSKEALQDFCLRSSLPCANLDWTRVSWQHLEKDKLTVNYCSQGITIPITVTTHPSSLDVGNQLKITIEPLKGEPPGSAEE